MTLTSAVAGYPQQHSRGACKNGEGTNSDTDEQLVERPCPQHDVWLHNAMILEHSTQLSGAWLSTIPREYISLLPKLCCVCRWRHHGGLGRALAVGQGQGVGGTASGST